MSEIKAFKLKALLSFKCIFIYFKSQTPNLQVCSENI